MLAQRVTGYVTRGCLLVLLCLGVAGTAPAADPQLVINELMYHTIEYWPTNQPAPTSNQTEYVELYNVGPTALTLTNYQFDAGILFSFTGGTLAPSNYLVICENLIAFTNAYPTVTNVVGEYSGSLANGGERLTLSRYTNGNWVTEDTLEYIDDDDSDGTGKSMELVHPALARLRNQYAGDWVASSTISGTPGRVNSRYTATPLPVAGDVRHDPPLPPAGSSVKVTVRATGRDGDAVNVVLQYRKDANPTNAWASTNMVDHGAEGDAVAADGTFTAFLPPPTNGPNPALVMANGELIEFRIRVTDTIGTRIFPATNRTDVPPSSALSYLVKFGEDTFSDCAYVGEYPTYHILMTAVNKNTLQTRPVTSDVLLDATLVTDGQIFYNAGVRLRGGTSRNSLLGNYRLDLPNPLAYNGMRRINFNHDNALLQHIGMVVTDRATGGYAFDSGLARVFLNEERKNPNQGIYHRFETFGDTMMTRIYGSEAGINQYNADGDLKAGYLQYVGDNPSSYFGLYYIDIGNPHTAWFDIIDLSRILNQSESTYPTVLTNRMHVQQWAKLFATQVALDNQEPGFLSPHSPYGDELRLSVDPSDGCFDIYPWDYDDVINSSALLWGYSGTGAGTVIRKFLFNRPVLPYYVGDVHHIITDVMSDANMNALFDSMGSKVAGQRASYLTTIQNQRAGLLAQINTSLTVTGLATGAPVLLVPSTNGGVRLSLAGTAPQNYTDRVLINGNDASWTPRFPTWTMTNVVTIPGDVADVVITTLHPTGSTLTSLTFKAVAQRTPVTVTGNITSNTTWTPAAGIYVISNDISVTAGAKLTIQPQTTVLLAAGRTLTVNGALDVLGSTNAPVNILPQGGTTPWAIVGSGTNAILVISNAVSSLGRISVSGGATLRVYDSTLSGSQDANGIVQASGAATVLLSRSIVRDFNRTRFDTSPTTIDQCLFENMSAVGIEFSGAAATATVRRSTLRNPLGTDGITFANATAGLVTNVLIEGMSGTGVAVRASVVTVVNTLVDACGTGLNVSGASSAVARNTTLVHCGVGVNGTPGLTNNIVWSVGTVAVTNGPATATSNDIQLPGTSTYAGSGNLNRDPFFRDSDSRDYQLLPISPCIGAGVGGATLGVTYPTGANPVAPTNLEAAASSNSVQLTWTDLSSDETAFEIHRSTDAGESWSLIGTAPGGATTYTDAGLVQNTAYAYRLRAIHARGASAFTDPQFITTSFQSMTQLLIDHLRITEIMYNPSDASDPSEFTEFIEFKNISTNVLLDLTGLHTDNGNDGVPYRYTFTNGTTLGPQHFFILARNAAGFAARYPGVTINDTYDDDDKLNNGGEDIWVRTAGGTYIVRFDFGDGSNGRSWYATTDGGGYSLVPVNPNPATDNLDDDLSWRASSALGGSPGTDDPEPLASGIVINEVLAHTDPPFEDAIELRNIGTNSVNVAGWYVSDDYSDLRKYRIPPSPARILAPGAFGVMYAAQTFDSTNAASPFNITELGTEPVILSASVGTNLTGYRALATFRGAIENMYGSPVSFGRYTRSDGRVDFVAMHNRTFGMDNPATLAQFRTGTGLPNSGPKVGPIVISEIMYNPGPSGKEFIELLNITNVSVRLFFDTNSMSGVPASAGTNVWRLRDAITYRFPTNTWMSPGERILITSQEPADFRAQFAIPSNIRIFGPFAGELNNAGDSVELVKPGDPEPNGTIPEIMVDRVAYQDNLPWPPEADNGGASLERLNAGAYGDDPTNWVAVTVGGTPGAPNNTTSVPTVGFRDISASSLETNATVLADVILQPAVSSTVTVSYVVSGGSATAGSDYSLAPGTLTFWPHETLKTISLAILNDNTPAGEPDENVEITLTNVSVNALLGGNRVYTHTIVDTDAATLAAPVILPSSTTDFTNSITVSIIPTVPFSEVFYTTDGSIPDRGDTFYGGPFSLRASARITARTFLGSYNAGNWTSVLLRAQAIPAGWTPPPPLPAGTIETDVRGTLDDGYQPNNTFPVQPANPSIAMLASTAERAFFRFFGTEIPAGADVTNAYLQFTASTNSGGTANLTIRGEAADHALPLEAARTNISGRLTTTNAMTWSPPAWTISERGPAQRTPNLAAIVREIVNRPGWNPTNGIAFIFQVPASTSASRVHAFDGSPDQAATLHVEWTPPLTQYYFGVLTNGSGTVSGGNLWITEGSNASATAMADPGHAFAGWTGDVGGADTNELMLSVLMDQNRTVTANFRAIAGNEPPRVITLAYVNPTNVTIQWISQTDYVYSVYRSTNLQIHRPGQLLATGLPADLSGTNTYNDTTATNPPAFYSVTGVQP